MATYTYLASTSVLPKEFSYPAHIGDLFDQESAQNSGMPSSTQWDLKDKNDLVLSFTGTGFTTDTTDGFPSGGTVTAITLKQGAVEVVKISGISLAAVDIAETFTGKDRLWKFFDIVLSGNDTVIGGAGGDHLEGMAGNDRLHGGAGDDFLVGGAGTDYYDGGEGDLDMISFIDSKYDASALRGIDLDASKGTVIDPYGNSETFTYVEQFRGSIFSDKMVGDGKDNLFQGMGGRDNIDGGVGTDTIDYSWDVDFGGRRGVTVDLSKGTAIDGFGFKDTLSNIENVFGTGNNDKITGNDQNNDLWGEGGNDTIDGGAGNDWFSGFTGNDTLTGGTGSDTFAFGGGLKKNVDTVTDFVVADDQIALDKAVFTKFANAISVTSGNFVIGTKAKDKNDHLIYDSKSGKLFYDADGSGKAAAVQIAQLEKNLKMTFADFELF